MLTGTTLNNKYNQINMTRNIFKFEATDRSTSGRSIGAITRPRMRLAILKAIKDIGENDNSTDKDLYDYLIKKINVTEVDIKNIDEIKQCEFKYRYSWCKAQLKKAELIEIDNEKKGTFKITKNGIEFLKKYELLDKDEIDESKFKNANKEIKTLEGSQGDKDEENEDDLDVQVTNYWAGGFGTDKEAEKRKEDFIKNNFWQGILYNDRTTKKAQKCIELFSQIKIGDKFIIKGWGGENNLNIHYYGEVISKDDTLERLEFKKIDKPFKHIIPPKSKGSGSWADTIRPIKIKEEIDLIFNDINTEPTTKNSNNVIGSNNIPNTKWNSKNIILYGPPGTGKTYNSINEAIAIIDSKFDLKIERKEVKKKYDQLEEQGQILFTTFHQSMSYEDFIEGLKPDEPVLNQEFSYSIHPGIFKRACALAAFQCYRKMNSSSSSNLPFDEIMKEYSKGTYQEAMKLYGEDAEPVVLIIDEINRGNISQIFGELITLIEEDKRLGKTESLEVLLPYSKKKFGVPQNLFIIGTMNTADRSVEALDTALRRRFTFIEIPPDVQHIPDSAQLQNLKGIDLRKLLSSLNERLNVLLSNDHMIGHSYFININSIDDLRLAFENKLIPLLKEYFYGDFGKISMVLGNDFVGAIPIANNLFLGDYEIISDYTDHKKWVFRNDFFYKTNGKYDQKIVAEFIEAVKKIYS